MVSQTWIKLDCRNVIKCRRNYITTRDTSKEVEKLKKFSALNNNNLFKT